MSQIRPTLTAQRLFQVAFALIVTVGLSVLLYQMAAPGDFHRALARMPWPRLALGAVALTAMFWTRTIKYNLALGAERQRPSTMYGVLAVYSFLKNLVPFRIGELSLLYLFKRRFGIPAARSSVVLYVGLASDMISLLILGFFSLAWLELLAPSELTKGLLLATGLLLCVGLLAYFFAAPFLALTMRFARSWTFFENDKTPARVFRLFEQFEAAFTKYSASQLSVFLALSAVTWLIRFWIIAIVLPGWDIRFSFVEVCAVTAMMSLLSALPIQGLAGFGTMEASWTLGFVALGVPVSQAVTVSFATHVAIILMMFVHFLVGWVLSARDRGGENDTDRGRSSSVAKYSGPGRLTESFDEV